MAAAQNGDAQALEEYGRRNGETVKGWFVETDDGTYFYTDKSYQDIEGWFGVQYYAGEAQQGDPQTWYYMSRDIGAPHGMVYDPVGGIIYEVNQVPGQSKWEQIESLIINSFSPDFAQAKVSVAYQYSRDDKVAWNKLWAREEGNTFLLSPVTVSNPAAATAWFQGQTGNAWNYTLRTNNCADYSVQGLNAGGASVYLIWGSIPSSFSVAPTMTWTAGQPYPVPIGK